MEEAANYPFQLDDGGRSNSRRPKQKDDCTVRAVAIAAGMPYDDAYDLLKDAGRQSSRRFRFDEWIKKVQPTINGHRIVRRTFPAVKGERRMNPETFCKQFRQGKYIVRTAKHVFAVVDGVARDAFKERPDRCIYACYEVVPE